MPPFHNYATFYGKFWVKNIFSRMQISGMEKKYPEKCFFDIKLHFLRKKKFFLQNFCDFWVFLKFRSMVAKSETGTWFFRIFRTFWHLYWPWVSVRIEMGNLEAKTPCVTYNKVRNCEGPLDALSMINCWFLTLENYSLVSGPPSCTSTKDWSTFFRALIIEHPCATFGKHSI